MSTWSKASLSIYTVFSTSAFFSETSASLRNSRQDNFNGDDLRGAMAIFPEFFRSCDICNKNLYHENMALSDSSSVCVQAEVENTPRDIKGWYKCEFGMK